MTEKSYKILIVDDDSSIADQLTEYLRFKYKTYQVDTGYNAETALKLMQRTDYDLVISDINMPGLTGTQLAKRIRESSNKSAIILITGYATLQSVVDAINIGISSYVIKPFSFNEIDLKIHKILSAREIDQLRSINQVLEGELRFKNQLYELMMVLGNISNMDNFIYTAAMEINKIYSVPLIFVWARFYRNESIQFFTSSDLSESQQLDIMREAADQVPAMEAIPEELERLSHRIRVFPTEMQPEKSEPFSFSMVYHALYNNINNFVIFGYDTHGDDQSDDKQVINFQLTLRLIQVLLKNVLLIEELDFAGSIDGLTKVFNHRFFHEFLDKEFQRSFRAQKPLSVVMLDVDNFKQLNDTHGHYMGDQVLVRLVTIIQNHIRTSDVLARYGGDEFSIILPDCPIETSAEICRRILDYVQRDEFMHSISTDISISMGIAEYSHLKLANSQELMIESDKALYQAKRMGKNTIYYQKISEHGEN
ncbi:MAG: diguanylate cyclase [Candidatus Delongbacteria bacterium]|nr:diguanylate cyclase [Candidatus Delongbacteria bacterium]